MNGVSVWTGASAAGPHGGGAGALPAREPARRAAPLGTMFRVNARSLFLAVALAARERRARLRPRCRRHVVRRHARSRSASTPPPGSKAGKRAPTILQTHGWGGSRDTNPDSASSDATGNVGTGPLRRAGLQRAHLGLARVRPVRRHGRGRLQGLRGPRRAGAARLAGQAARGAGSTSPATRAWACTASPTRAGSSSSRRGSTSASTRSRPTIAWHSLLTSLYKEDTVKGGWSALLYAGGQTRAAGQPHHLGVRLRRGHREAVGGGPRVVRVARARRRARRPHPRPHAAAPGHAGHAVHAHRGDPQLRDPAPQRRAAEDDVVLRRPRHVPDRHRPGRPLRVARDRVAAPLRRRAPRSPPAPAWSGWPTTPCGAARAAGRRRRARRSSPTGSGTLVVSPADTVSGTAARGRRRRQRGQRRDPREDRAGASASRGCGSRTRAPARRPMCSPRSSTRGATSCSATR